jgi:N-methylhydantoinase B
VERDPAAVLDDVINELVSIERARAEYGVIIDPVTMQVREQETVALRAEMRRADDGARVAVERRTAGAMPSRGAGT